MGNFIIYKGFFLGVENTFEIPTMETWRKLIYYRNITNLTQAGYEKIMEKHYAYVIIFDKVSKVGLRTSNIDKHYSFLPVDVKTKICSYIEKQKNGISSLQETLESHNLLVLTKYAILEAWVNDITSLLGIGYDILKKSTICPEWFKENINYTIKLFIK